jgi:hypothetical protein
MAVTAHVYPQIQQKMASKAVNLGTDSLKVMLVNGGSYDNTDVTIADVKANAGFVEASGTAYVAGGAALASVTVTTSGNVTTLTCANPAWAASTITATGAVFYDAAGGTDATNFPIVYWDFGGAQSSSNGSFTLSINGSGLATFTAS